MRRIVSFLLLLLFLNTCALAQESEQLIYLYDNYCASCDVKAEFQSLFKTLTGKNANDYHAVMYDAYSVQGQELLEQIAAEQHLNIGDLRIPLLVVDGVLYNGDKEIQQKLPYDFVSRSGSDESLLYYLYTPMCERCADASAILATLPQDVNVCLGQYEFSSSVVIERIDATCSPWLAQEIFDLCTVPEERRVTPAIMIGNEILTGNRISTNNLLLRLEQGTALHTPLLTSNSQHTLFDMWGTFIAGLTAGLNPCALSMLLLFLSLVLSLPKHGPSAVIAYLGGKFFIYFLIGRLFLRAFQLLNPTWVAPVARILMTLLCVIVITLNLWDAVSLLKTREQAVRNQLPRTLRHRIQKAIRSMMSKAGTYVPVAALVLGILVGCGEFLCAGQLYLASLLNHLQQASGFLTDLPLLLTYCIGFLLPSVALSTVVLVSRQTLQFVLQLGRKQFLIKLLTALVMLAMLIAAWV